MIRKRIRLAVAAAGMAAATLLALALPASALPAQAGAGGGLVVRTDRG